MNKATDVTDIFNNAKNNDGSVEIQTNTNTGELKILFDADAVKDIGGKTVYFKTNVIKNSTAISDSEFVIEVTLTGSTFSNGKAKVSIPLKETVPEGKILKVYFINGDERVDMNATLENGLIIFETEHFSTYAVVFEDAPSNTGGDSPILFIAIGIVAVLALAGGIFLFLKKRA